MINDCNNPEFLALCKWKKQYIEAILDQLHPVGDVLEIGFGLGYAADKIQSFHPKSHTIIERDPIIAQEAKHWAIKHPKVSLIEADWSEVLHKLGRFDTIFYNGFPIVNEVETVKRQEKERAVMTANQAKKILLSIEEQLSQITVAFSDEQIDEFYETIGKTQKHELPKFFTTLKKYGFITDKQYKRALQKYVETTHLNPSKEKGENERLIRFIESCFAKHTRKGSRISSYLISPTSLYEDTAFFEAFITNPNIDYQEKLIELIVPDCPYKDAIVMSLQRLS